jgi:integrase
MKEKLTEDLVKGTAPNPTRNIFIWDTEADRLGLLVTPAGYRGFVFQYHRNGKDRRMRLGEYGKELTLHKARKRAEKLRLEVKNGGDPAQEREELKTAPTVADLAGRFMEEHASCRKPATTRLYRICWDRHIVPALGSKRVAEVSWADLAALHRTMKGTPAMANRMLVTASKAWALAARWGWFPRDAVNPARGHDRFREQQRGQACGAGQLAEIGAALRAEKGSISSSAFLFALLTGARPGEVLAMRWDNLEGRVWRLPDAKSGGRSVYVGESAAKVLEGLPRGLDCFVFPGATRGRALASMRSLWDRIAARADLPASLRLYDATRHTFASAALELGIPLERVKVLVGHAASGDITARYTHLKTETYLADADLVSRHLWAALQLELPESNNVRAFPAAANDR